jgi:hypothetical protein
MTLSVFSFTLGYILFIYILAFIFGFLYRFILRFLVKTYPTVFYSKQWTVRGKRMNIGKNDRIIRMVVGIILLVMAIPSLNPVLLFFSGFCFFETIFSWCGFFALIGKNSCPIE